VRARRHTVSSQARGRAARFGGTARVLAVVGWFSVGLAQAQDAVPPAPPSGPADIMNQANEGRRKSELQRAVNAGQNAASQQQQQQAPATVAPSAPAGAPGKREVTSAPAPVPGGAPTSAAVPAPSDAAPDSSASAAAAAHAHAHVHGGRDPQAVLAEPVLPTAEPKRGLAPGSVEVSVVGPDGSPQPGAEIMLGVMASMGGRTEQRAKADAKGQHTFTGLAVGSKQAYRVNVLQSGAKFSTTPFRLPEELGYQARMVLKPTTNDTRLMFQVIGQTVIELRDDRLHITQQGKLANAGQSVIAFPKEGLVVPLPPGFTAFSWQDVMTDQKGEELADKGFRIRGSLPPGSVTLAWTFDLQRSGSAAKITIDQPWRSYTYRVISEAPPGLKLRVTDFPETERIQDTGRELLFTQVQRAPSEAPLASVSIRIDGIPGPGPGRWVAVVLAVLAVATGLGYALRPGDRSGQRDERRTALEARKQQLVTLAKQTDTEHAAGEIGPQFRAERLREIATELAMVLRDEETLASATKREALAIA